MLGTGGYLASFSAHQTLIRDDVIFLRTSHEEHGHWQRGNGPLPGPMLSAHGV